MNYRPPDMTLREYRERRDLRRGARAAKGHALGLRHTRGKATGSFWKWWSARCDALWGLAVRARDRAIYGDVCRIRRAAQCTGRNECGYHLLSKARGHSIRWILAAGVAACGPCNRGEQLNRQKYAEYHEDLFGRPFMDDLRARARRTVKLSVPDLEALARALVAGCGGSWSPYEQWEKSHV